ncbi:cyclic nucleotide-gated ion channel 1-like [Humulus lupulus]|uniref:cyclic nucleotide-gated ion channel 1-like n=1 Tax=Humulus lupulus TaxID=3486 RepID=UPI002B40EA72|nr:cyclic nucleotide-gated ion channel 1-like [Humulus lupulus]
MDKKIDTKAAKILNPWTAYSRLWNKTFLASCVIGVSIDPLFLYIPIVNDDRKCLDRDHNIMIISLVLRSITDFSYVLHIIFRFKMALDMSKELSQSIFTKFPWSYLLIDVLAILPLPQVVVLVYFSKITGSSSLTARKFINILLLLQYVPRILRVYFSAKDLGRAFDSLTRRLWVRGAFFFFLYVISGHVFGVRMWKVMHGKKYEVPSQNQLVMSGVTHTLINGMIIPHTFHVRFYSLTSPSRWWLFLLTNLGRLDHKWLVGSFGSLSPNHKGLFWLSFWTGFGFGSDILVRVFFGSDTMLECGK